MQYAKLPDDIAQRYILLLDPMLGKIIYISYCESSQLSMAIKLREVRVSRPSRFFLTMVFKRRRYSF